MKESTSFSKEDKEKISLNFFDLRQKGVDYIQEFCGENWTDFNSHDPGVTILEQLCYALTDVSLRTSHNMNDILVPKENKEGHEGNKVEAKKNAFYPPSEIYSTHPVTILDIRKVIIDRFIDIHNVWIKTTENYGLEEKVTLIERVDILLKPIIHLGEGFEKMLKDDIKKFISAHRNLGEDVETICFLKPKYVALFMEIHIVSEKNIDEVFSNCLLALFEYVYTPVGQHTREEMLKDGYSIKEIRTGPKLKNGFIKDDSLRERRISLSKRGIENNLSLVDSVYKCEVKDLEIQDKNELNEDEFFHLFDEKQSNNFTLESFEPLYESITIIVNNEKINLSAGNKNAIHDLFYEKWTKKYGPYAIRDIQDFEFNQNLKGTNYGLKDYYSIQNHFPLIYGIGKEGLTSETTTERKAKAKQLKGYLLFFEQYLANYLSQISHVEDFFSIEEVGRQTYFSQVLNNYNVPNIDIIHPKKRDNASSRWKENFFDRKDRIYSHLLARFGENLNPIPLKISLQKGLIEDEEELRRKLLVQKANYLRNIVSLSGEQIKGEIFSNEIVKGKNKRRPSGLENIILEKTSIEPRLFRSLDIKKYTNEETFYIVDHILLRDFITEMGLLNEVKYGFKIIDAEDKLICETKDEHFWSTKQERTNHFDQFLQELEDDNLFQMKDGITSRLKTNIIGEVITFTDDPKEKNKRRSRAEIKELISLFNPKVLTNGGVRLMEVEKIRAKGVHELSRGEYGQRRLVFQRKLSNFLREGNDVIIDEDFFNLSISLVFPNWSERYKNEQFRSYLADLVIERVPSHIRVNLCTVNRIKMESFAKEYHHWETLKVKLENDDSRDVRASFRKASYAVYAQICEILKANKEQAKRTREMIPPEPRNRLNQINNIVI